MVINKIHRYLKKKKIQSLKNYYSVGNSILTENFNLRLDIPEKRKYLFIGDENMISGNYIFESKSGIIKIGNHNYIGNSTFICNSSIIIENYVTIAWGTYFYTHDSHSLDYKERQNDINQQLKDYHSGLLFIKNKNWNVVKSKPIHICSNAWIGLNCIILKGVTIGEGAVVGAGSVVTHDVPAWTVVAGNPAEIVKTIEH
jgi:galactoside O-acetyltransferase